MNEEQTKLWNCLLTGTITGAMEVEMDCGEGRRLLGVGGGEWWYVCVWVGVG